HKERAVHQKWDSIETIVYYSVKQACSNLKNVTFNIPKMQIGSYEVFGKRIAYTHGDTIVTVGNPGTHLNIKELENNINKINAAMKDTQEYAAVIYGHTHVGHIVYLSN